MELINKRKLIKVIMVTAAITSIAFLAVVEAFNDISLDDIGFTLILKNGSIWSYMVEMYFTWQGRFMSFFLIGLQLKSYLFFNTMLPFTIFLYVVNILLLTVTLMRFFKTKLFYSFLFAIIFHQLYVYSMLDISSYFWMCTKSYTLIMSVSLFALSEIIYNMRQKWYDYVVLLITFAFLGCSYEIYAPIILLLMGCVLLYKLYQSKVKTVLIEEKKFVFSFAVCLLFFSLMIIAPGNWVRMNVYAKGPGFVLSTYIFTVFKNSIWLIKMLFLKAHYFVIAGILLFAIISQLNIQIRPRKSVRSILRRILFYAFISAGLCFVSISLNTFVVGDRMIMRAFNHINLICFLFIGFSLYEVVSSELLKKMPAFILPLTVTFVIGCNIYCFFKSVPELKAYKESVNVRMTQLELLRTNGNRETIKLKSLNAAEYHSVDDLWKFLIPTLTPQLLLNPNEVSNRVNHYYNIKYREYYKLDFDVTTDLSLEL
jgi:hypothetical protein